MDIVHECGVNLKRWALPLCIYFNWEKEDPLAYIAVEILCFYLYVERWKL